MRMACCTNSMHKPLCCRACAATCVLCLPVPLCCPLQLEDVDLVHVSDVWRLAAHHVQRVSRRERQQQKEQGTASAAAAGSVTAGSSGSNGLAMQPGTTKDAARRSSGEGDAGKQPRTNGVQQAAAATGGSERDSERDSSAVPAAPAACNDAGGAAEAGADAAAAAATAAAAGSCVVVGARDLPPPRELVLRPVKPGPPPDVLKRMWEDIQQVRRLARLCLGGDSAARQRDCQACAAPCGASD